jgi:signal transduction histidine kinase
MAPQLRQDGAVVLGVIGCLLMLSLGLMLDVQYRLVIFYAFPVIVAAWYFGRVVAAGMTAIALSCSIVVALAYHHNLEYLPAGLVGLALLAVLGIGGAEWSRRSDDLLAELTESDQRHRQVLETMTMVGRELVTEKRVDIIAKLVMDSLVRDLQLDAAWVYQRKAVEGSARLDLLAVAGIEPAEPVIPAGSGLLGRALDTGHVVLVGSSEELDRVGLRERFEEDAGIVASIAIPLFVRGKTWGTVLLGDRAPRQWTEEETGIASALVNQLGLAMENANATRSNIEAMVRLEEVNQLKSDFLKTASHELRTPMTVVGGYVDMMADGSLGDVPPAWRMPIDQVKSKFKELNRLVQMILDAARSDQPALKVHLENVEVGDLVETAVTAQQSETANAGRRLRMEPRRVEIRARLDRDKVLVAVRNLIENATKYSPPGSDIDIGFQDGDGSVKLWVADRGPGIKDQEKPRIFDQFYRVDRTETSGVSGSGLGLFIVRQMTEAQGGRVLVEDRPGGGTVFTLLFPRKAAAAA